MATVANHSAAMARRCLSRRLLSSVLLGHFHQPEPVPPVGTRPDKPLTVPAFEPLTASSPRLSLDFVPNLSHFSLYDSHLGLLLLRHRNCDDFNPRLFLVCDPAVCVAVDCDRPRAWVASYRDGEVRWRALPRASRDVAVEFDIHWLEYLPVRAAGSLYWHICYNPCALALDVATLRFSFLRVPAHMFDGVTTTHKCRIGEMPDDGRLCVGSVEKQELMVCVRGTGDRSDNGWVVERHVRIAKALRGVPGLPKDSFLRHYYLWMRDFDAGRTGKVFIGTMGFGIFSYDLNTGELKSLATEDGMQYGHPILPYFSAPANGGSD
uniref:DUF1618 domain-containing protein n=1 Tax=Leersia perrieri TaxID=77586 RepID=A0A0D9XBR7_9ORYZ